MPTSLPVLPPARHFGETSRPDAWWVQPAIVFVVFASFIGYATWAAFQNEHYTFGPYLSPFYSPELYGESPHAWFGPRPEWWPGWLPFSAALIILPFPGLFRFTCYYYRGAYYKAFWADPPNCAVGEPRKGYRGERYFPLVLQNVHRYFLYIALLFLALLAHDVWKAMWFARPDGGAEFGIGIGTLVLALNVGLLSSYTLGCHSLRHLVGGRLDQISRHPVQHACYQGCSRLNRNHMRWAWASLFSVAFADVYVRLCSMGIWVDWRIL
ncbi:MAG: succinate dehydrogenase [Gemmatimonadetes bacterium]|nr:succinate dehydrogenase [Gemmatimonadota bacterium]